MSPAPESIASATRWKDQDPNPTTAAYVQSLLDKKGDAAASRELTALFPPNDRRISFGTAGLRAAMKPGPLCMNDLTVVQAAQGLARWCQSKQQPTDDNNKKLIAVVGYDHRENKDLNISSLSFAIHTALVFEQAGMECILLGGFVLTPLVPFVLNSVGAAVGIMITASHNPKQDDGYKVYASDGCQIRSPMDKEISEFIMENLEPWVDYRSMTEGRRQNHAGSCLGLSNPSLTQEMITKYFEALQSSGLRTGQALKESSDNNSKPSFAYSAMHGVGHRFAVQVFESFGLPPFLSIPEQQNPDPAFPTVPFPNPEEKGALNIAKAFAEKNGCNVVLANDPDADRLAVAELDPTTKKWTVFHGDQIGTMLGLWIWEQVGENCGKPVAMCASTVSSKMLAEIARVEGFHFEDTLTGFKWIGSRASALSRDEGYRSLFAYEEAIGFCCGDVIFDKDGISAMAVFAELAHWVYSQGMTLTQHMQKLYDKYGEFVSHNGYYFLEDNSVVETIMEHIRCNGTYKVDVSPYEIASIRDLGEPGYDSTTEDKKPTLPTSKSSPMMTLRFTNGCVAQFRASGTEPKFKFYIEMKGTPGVARSVVEQELQAMAKVILEKLLQPDKNGLTLPAHASL